MNITLCSTSALYITRKLRRTGKGGRLSLSAHHCDLQAPDRTPYARWSKKRLTAFLAERNIPTGAQRTLAIAVPSRESRLQLACVKNTVFGPATLPAGAFVSLGDGAAISSPELLFAEMARSMTEAGHLMLGHELCGGFVRDPDDPLNGNALMEVPPVTSVSRIAGFLSQLKNFRGLDKALQTLDLLADNAWSPTESVVATLACLPAVSFGYELAPVILNERHYAPAGLRASAEKASRVPDIMFGKTGVGINYDGAVHLDLDSIAARSREAADNPDDMRTQRALERTMRAVRASYVDDIRRNRELAADGLVVFPVVKEDLYEQGGLDKVMRQVMTSIEERTGRELAITRTALSSRFLCERRQRLVRSLLPGSRGAVPDLVTVYSSGGDHFATIGF